jgi:hypothetical protein
MHKPRFVEQLYTLADLSDYGSEELMVFHFLIKGKKFNLN